MSGMGQNRKSSVGLGMSGVGGEADENRAKADMVSDGEKVDLFMWSAGRISVSHPDIDALEVEGRTGRLDF